MRGPGRPTALLASCVAAAVVVISHGATIDSVSRSLYVAQLGTWTAASDVITFKDEIKALTLCAAAGQTLGSLAAGMYQAPATHRDSLPVVQLEDGRCATIDLSAAGVQKGKENTLVVRRYMLGALRTDPEEIDFEDISLGLTENRMVFTDALQLDIPGHRVLSESVAVTLPSTRVEEYTAGGQLDAGDSQGDGGKASKPKKKKSQTTIKWLNVGQWSGVGERPQLRVEFWHNGVLLEGERVQRVVAVPLLSSTRVTELYTVRNAAPRVLGHFDRMAVEMARERRERKHVSSMVMVDRMAATLPPGATDFVLRDRIGLIFTGTQVSEPDFTAYLFEPRYVLLGGQSTTFQLSYSLPTTGNPKPEFNLIKKDGSQAGLAIGKGQMPLAVVLPLGPSLSEVAFDRCEVEVRLPWGANVLHVDAPPSARVTLGTHHWPLDFLGSKSVTIAAEKCTPWDLENDVRVYFAISRLKLFLNPVTFLGFAASLFVVIFPKAVFGTLARLVSTKDQVLRAIEPEHAQGLKSQAHAKVPERPAVGKGQEDGTGGAKED